MEKSRLQQQLQGSLRCSTSSTHFMMKLQSWKLCSRISEDKSYFLKAEHSRTPEAAAGIRKRKDWLLQLFTNKIRLNYQSALPCVIAHVQDAIGGHRSLNKGTMNSFMASFAWVSGIRGLLGTYITTPWAEGGSVLMSMQFPWGHKMYDMEILCAMQNEIWKFLDFIFWF
jgi:hypothetical protein